LNSSGTFYRGRGGRFTKGKKGGECRGGRARVATKTKRSTRKGTGSNLGKMARRGGDWTGEGGKVEGVSGRGPRTGRAQGARKARKRGESKERAVEKLTALKISRLRVRKRGADLRTLLPSVPTGGERIWEGHRGGGSGGVCGTKSTSDHSESLPGPNH